MRQASHPTGFKHLFVGNPMFVEIQREKNKALAEHNWRGGQLAARVLLLVIYLFLLILTLRYVEYVEPVVLMYVMLGLATILIPAGLHGAIAGDREKRSLDMLLVAPVTPGQIIVGKFGKTFLSLMMLIVAIGIPAFIIELVKQGTPTYRYGMQIDGITGYFQSLVLVIAASLAMGGMTMWISSKTRSNSGAMLATVGALFVLFVVVPAIGGVLGTLSPGTAEALVYTNPFVLLAYAYTGDPSSASLSESVGSRVAYLWPTIGMMFIATVMFLALATENLRKLSKGRVDS